MSSICKIEKSFNDMIVLGLIVYNNTMFFCVCRLAVILTFDVKIDKPMNWQMNLELKCLKLILFTICLISSLLITR